MRYGLFLLLSMSFFLQADELTNFGKNKWSMDKWEMVKSSRWDSIGSWIQNENCIENKCPDVPKRDLLGKYAGEIYTVMLLKEEFKNNLITFSSTMEFDDRMAPGLLISHEKIVKDHKNRPELRDHYEIILFDKGINIWYHYFENGKQKWIKKAFLKRPFKPKTKYNMIVSIKKAYGKRAITVEIDGDVFGCYTPELTSSCRIGIVGCEGINRFYDFRILRK